MVSRPKCLLRQCRFRTRAREKVQNALWSINLSDVVRPLVDLVLRDKALARCSTIGHSELNPFEQRFGAVGDWVPCHVSFSFYPRRLGAVARAIDPTFDKLSRALRAN